jgi:hypothetical protein
MKKIDEVLTTETPIKSVIDDFIGSDDPRFEGKSEEERRQMAIAAWFNIKRKGKNDKRSDLGRKVSS